MKANKFLPNLSIKKVWDKLTKHDNEISQLSNPNLLINEDFQVWQRGTSFDSDGSKRQYTADRWCIWCNANVTRNNGQGLKITIDTVDYGGLHQHMEVPKEMYENLINREVTLTTKFAVNRDMNMIIRVGVQDYNFEAKSGDFSTYTCTFKLTEDDFTSDSNSYWLQVTPIYCDVNNKFSIGDEIQLSYVKLEQGTIATPFVPRTYAEELAMCQRYYQVIETLSPYIYDYPSEIKIAVGVGYGEMRITPTITYVGSYTYDTSGNSMTHTKYLLVSNNERFAILHLTFPKAHHDLATGCNFSLKLDAEFY